MAHVDAVAVGWTEIEGHLVQLVNGALGTAQIQAGGAVGLSGNWVARVAMEQAETIRTRIKLVDATVAPLLEGSELAEQWVCVKDQLQKNQDKEIELSMPDGVVPRNYQERSLG